MVPTDKDGGFAIISDCLIKEARHRILCNGDYSVGYVNHDTATRIHANLSKRWATALEAPGLASKLGSSIACKSTLSYSILELTCKTHKSPVEFRNLHASTMWRYGALSKFLANFLQCDLNRQAHILKDSRSLVHALSKLEPLPQHKFAKFDVKHFYMTGTSTELGELASKSYTNHDDPPLRDLVQETILFLLEHQQVLDKSSNSLVKVTRGSGMGLPHSGAIAESALLNGGEQNALLQMTELGIDFYARFRDDIFVIFRDYDNLGFS